jgi:hypothetical protein
VHCGVPGVHRAAPWRKPGRIGGSCGDTLGGFLSAVSKAGTTWKCKPLEHSGTCPRSTAGDLDHGSCGDSRQVREGPGEEREEERTVACSLGVFSHAPSVPGIRGPAPQGPAVFNPLGRSFTCVSCVGHSRKEGPAWDPSGDLEAVKPSMSILSESNRGRDG